MQRPSKTSHAHEGIELSDIDLGSPRAGADVSRGFEIGKRQFVSCFRSTVVGGGWVFGFVGAVADFRVLVLIRFVKRVSFRFSSGQCLPATNFVRSCSVFCDNYPGKMDPNNASLSCVANIVWSNNLGTTIKKAVYKQATLRLVRNTLKEMFLEVSGEKVNPIKLKLKGELVMGMDGYQFLVYLLNNTFLM